WRMVVVENAGPFERQLVILVELAAPGLVSAKEGVGAGAYDEFIGGVVAAAGKYRTLHGSQYGCLVAALLDEGQCGIQGLVGEGSGLFGLDNLSRALEQAQSPNHARCIDNLAEGLQLLVQTATVIGGQPMGVVLDADACAEQIEVIQEVAQVDRRIGVRPVR